jgi:hypothetical protein
MPYLVWFVAVCLYLAVLPWALAKWARARAVRERDSEIATRTAQMQLVTDQLEGDMQRAEERATEAERLLMIAHRENERWSRELSDRLRVIREKEADVQRERDLADGWRAEVERLNDRLVYPKPDMPLARAIEYMVTRAGVTRGSGRGDGASENALAAVELIGERVATGALMVWGCPPLRAGPHPGPFPENYHTTLHPIATGYWNTAELDASRAPILDTREAQTAAVITPVNAVPLYANIHLNRRQVVGEWPPNDR